MNYTELYDNIQRKGSFLCVGLDTDPEKIPACVRERHGDASMLAFNKAIIDATAKYAVAYKPNIAFYEAEGVAGWQQLAETVRYIRSNYPDIFIIADAKRGDIGNTADRYARAFFETMDFDAVTLAPYMGSDSIRPFLKHSGRWGIVLAMTSNKSAEEFETLPLSDGMPLYERVIRDTVRNVNTEFGDSRERLMFVVGATRPEKLAEIRRYCPDHFLLVPGVGAQGGSLEEVARHRTSPQPQPPRPRKWPPRCGPCCKTGAGTARPSSRSPTISFAAGPFSFTLLREIPRCRSLQENGSQYGDADPLAQPLKYLEKGRELHVRLPVLNAGDIRLLRAYLRRQLLLRQTGLTAFLLQPLRQDKCLRLPVKSLSLIRPGNSKIL